MTLSKRIRAAIVALLASAVLAQNLACQAQAKPGASALRSTPIATGISAEQVHQQFASSRSPSQVSAAVAPPNAIRIAKPGAALVSVSSDLDRMAVLRGGDGIVHVQVNLTSGGVVASTGRRATDLVVVLDRSGSMSGAKLFYAKEALRELIGRLHDDDRLGIVAYDSVAEVLSPMRYATAAARREFYTVCDGIDVRGNTNMSDGLDLGQGMLEQSRQSNRPGRILLLSDGLANTGDSSIAGLTARARRAIGGEYALSTMGIGADFDERLMTQLATAGAGAFYYLAKLTVLPQFFDAELQTASTTIASGAKLTLYTGSGVSVVDAMGLETQVLGNRTEIAVGSLYAGQERTIWLTLKVPSRDLGTVSLGELSLDYRVGTGASQSVTEALPRLDCVAEWEEFRRLIKKSVWERAIVEEELSRAQERLGDAIASGSNADVEREVTSANEHRKLAKSLGSKKVEQAIVQLESSAASAKMAQQYAPAARNSAAKSQKSTGYMMRNSAKYINVDPFVGF